MTSPIRPSSRQRLRRFPVPFTVFDGLGLVAWTVIAQVVAGLGLALFLATASVLSSDPVPDPADLLEPGPGLLLLFAVIQIFTFAGVIAYLAARRRLSRHLLGPGRARLRHVVSGIGAGAAGFVLVVVFVRVGNALFGPVDPPEQAAMEAAQQGGLAFLLGLLVASILAPLVEETVFRGVLFQSLRSKSGVAVAVAISSLAFMAVHIEVTQPIFSLALGVLAVWLALVFHWSGSLIVPVFAHATFNAISLSLATAA